MDQPGDAAALAEAQALRAAGDWRGAAAAYARHLDAAPRDWPIWVQHGHCVKESGDPLGAILSYRRAEAGMPEDADLPLQIGHALKLAGDLAGARAAYARALALDPVGEDPWREVSALLDAAPAEGSGLGLRSDLQVVLDLSDMMAWFGGARAPTGIQRVQMEIAGAALAAGQPGAGHQEAVIRLAVFRPESGTWREIPREAFHRLAGLSRAGADPSDPAWTQSLARVRARLEAAPDLGFPDGAWLVNLGSSWWLPGYHQAVREARARHGLRYAAMVHDTGPVSAPEHSPPATSARFARWFSVLATEADLLLAPSQATAQDIARLAARDLPGLPLAPLRVLRPDAVPSAPPARAAPHPRLADLAGEPYVLFLATIESRKDHLFVLNAWLALLRRHGAAVPMLVLAGRAGFNAEPVLALLRRAPALEGRVVWLDDLPDAAVAALLRGALFTIYHSRLEGWGLPVTEALAAGKAVVAPGHSGLLEAGQGLALHHAAGSEPEFLALVERLLFAPGFREATEARIAAGLRLRGWAEVAAELLGALADASPADHALPPPPLGTAHRLAELDMLRPGAALLWAEMLRTGAGWHEPEPWGCWTRPGRALLRLPLPPGTGPLRLHLALRGADAARSVALRLGRQPRVALEVAAAAQPVAVLDLPEPGPVAEIAIEAAPLPEQEDASPGIGIGVRAVMACAPDDVAARLGFLERLAFVWPEPA